MKSRILVSMLVIALSAALVGGATMAIFTAEDATNERTYAAGKLDVTAGDIKHYEVATIENMAPGDTINGSFTVTNAGSLDLWFTVDAITSGALFEGVSGEVKNAAQVSVDSPEVILGPDESAEVFFDVYLPIDASNVYQEKQGKLQFKVNAEQADHNLPEWEGKANHWDSVAIDGGQYYENGDKYYVELTLSNKVVGDLEEFAIALYNGDKLLQKNIATGKVFEEFASYNSLGSTFKLSGDDYWYINNVGNTAEDWLGDEDEIPNKIVVTGKCKWGVNYTWSLDFDGWDNR